MRGSAISLLATVAVLAPANGLALATPHARATQPALMSSVRAPPTAARPLVPARAAPPLLSLRGGLAFAAPATIDGGFNLIFGALATAVATLVISTREKRDANAEPVPKAVRSLQMRFLIVFWLFKMADWLQGPYFYEVYASKVINGVAVSSAGVARLFLTGFGSTALFGAVVGGLVDTFGRKKGSLAFSLAYAISALSTRCAALPSLFAGRVAGGIGTSLLFSAPECEPPPPLVHSSSTDHPSKRTRTSSPLLSFAVLLSPTHPPIHPPAGRGSSPSSRRAALT